MSQTGYADFYQSGVLQHLDQSHFHIGSAGHRLFSADDQPAGCFDVPPMATATLQLLIHGGGSGRFDLGAGRFSAVCRPGSWLVTPPNQSCRFDLDFGLSVLVMELPEGLWSSDTKSLDLASLHGRMNHDPAIAGLVRTIWEDSVGDDPLGPLWQDTAMMTLQGMLVRKVRTTAAPGRSIGGLATWQTRRVTEYMAAMLEHPLTLPELATICGLSTFHFARAFKLATGISPHRYLTRLRIDRAQLMLRGTKSPVTEIALAVGYESSQALARAFMRDVGMSPTEWRRPHVR